MLKTRVNRTQRKDRRKRAKLLRANAEFMERYNSREAVNQRSGKTVELNKRRQSRRRSRLAKLQLNGQFLANATSIAEEMVKDI